MNDNVSPYWICPKCDDLVPNGTLHLCFDHRIKEYTYHFSEDKKWDEETYKETVKTNEKLDTIIDLLRRYLPNI